MRGEKVMINAEGMALIKKWEGCSLKPYLCPANVWTIGYGHTDGVNKKTPPITKEEAEKLLHKDIEKFEDGVLELVTFSELNENQFSALVSFAFNVGLDAFGRSTMLKLLNQHKPIAASKEFGRWIYANKKPSKGLKSRREEERLLFLKPAIVINRSKTINK